MSKPLVLRKAQRKRVKLKIGLVSASGGGKTLGSLLIAYGIVRNSYPSISDEEVWEKIAIIDTENGSGELYSNRDIANIHIGEYCTVPLEPPFESSKYIEAINLCYNSGIEVIIVDSLTHLWSGEGGALDKQANIAKRTGNSFTSWKEPKKEFRAVIDKILQTDSHFITTMRSKVEYSQEKDGNGKTTVRKVGTAPVAMDGVDYEFSVVFDLDFDHIAAASKDRTGLFDGKYIKLSPDVGKALISWVNETPEVSKEKVVATQEFNSEDNVKSVLEEIKKEFSTKLDIADKSGNRDKAKSDMYSIVERITGNKNFMTINDVSVAKSVLTAIKNY